MCRYREGYLIEGNVMAHIKRTTRVLLCLVLLSLTCVTTSAGEATTIDDESFGVFYENPMNNNRGLILYISAKNCVGSYRVINNEIVLASGNINGRGPEKTIPFGTTKFRIDCGPLQSLVVTRE